MRVILPLTITDAILTSSTCAEPAAGETAYNGATNYTVGDKAYDPATHRVYKSITGGSGKPQPVYPETENDDWLDVGPTLAWAMFDLDRNGKTTCASPLTVVLEPGQKVNSIGIAGIVADQVVIEVKKGATVIFTETISLRTRIVRGWYDFFTAPFRYKSAVLRRSLPARSGVIITITATRATGDVSIGSLSLGNSIFVGRTTYSPDIDKRNYSDITRDADGNTALTRERSIPIISANCRTPASNVERLQLLQEELNGVPAFWYGLDNEDSPYFAALLILGIYTRFKITPDQAEEANVALDLKEV